MNRRTFITIIILIILVVLVVITFGISVNFLLKKDSKDSKDSKNPKDSSDYITKFSNKAQKETMKGKGSKGDWGEYQTIHIQYIIADSLLSTQTEITQKEMNIQTFVDMINSCLQCITKNFSSKYTYVYVTDHIKKIGKDKEFDQWFKNLYNTCDCNDLLGKLLAKLLKEVWTQKVLDLCPSVQEEITSCINQINVSDFNEPNAVQYFYNMLTDCIEKSCPGLLDKK